MQFLIKTQISEPELGRNGDAWVNFPIAPLSSIGHLIEAANALQRWRSLRVRFSLIGHSLDFNSLQSLEHVQELTAVSAELSSGHPWLYTLLKCKWHFSWDYRVTNHYLHTTLQLVHNLVIRIFLCASQSFVWKHREKNVTRSIQQSITKVFEKVPKNTNTSSNSNQIVSKV